ncbi:hypothetical protein I4U23_025786 [Adineta vaga]|nr:hypothetical protein I4U23_025786 [Adineta vaga]
MASNTQTPIVQLQCIPDNRYAVTGVLNTKRVRFDIETKSKSETEKRTPLNLALILDRSGSMESDNKLTFAKRAVISVLNLLHDDDIVHLIAYDSDVSIVFENARASTRQHLYGLVDNITTAGSTNMSGGIQVGADLLDKYVYEGFARRLFLFSDGQANVGMKTRAELTNLVANYNNKGIITDSFGIGADFDAEIMKGIADAGGSRFFFLETAQVIEPLVTKALVSVFGVCGSQTRLIVRGKNGSVVTKIWGHDDIVAGANLGDLHSNNLRSVLCEFTIAASGPASADGQEVESLAYELRYLRPDDTNGEPVSIKNSLSLKFVEDASLVANIDPHVQTMYATQTAADMDIQVAELVKNGKRKEAIEVVNAQLAILRDVEKYDNERGMIALQIRLAENMQNKLKDENVHDHIVYQGYAHQGYLKRQCSEECMAFYD